MIILIKLRCLGGNMNVRRTLTIISLCNIFATEDLANGSYTVDPAPCADRCWSSFGLLTWDVQRKNQRKRGQVTGKNVFFSWSKRFSGEDDRQPAYSCNEQATAKEKSKENQTRALSMTLCERFFPFLINGFNYRLHRKVTVFYQHWTGCGFGITWKTDLVEKCCWI